MNFTKAFTYIFDDKDWTSKLVLPLLCSLIPIIGGLIFLGYWLRVTKNVSRRDPLPLPELDFGEDLALGFKWIIVNLIYGLPLLAFAVLFAVVLAVRGEGPSFLAVVFAGLIGLSAIAYALFIWLIAPVGEAHFAQTGKIKDGLEFGFFAKLFSKNVMEWLMVLGGAILAGFIAPIGSVAFFIGALITSAYAASIVAHLKGQAYAISAEREGLPIESKPVEAQVYNSRMGEGLVRQEPDYHRAPQPYTPDQRVLEEAPEPEKPAEPLDNAELETENPQDLT